MSYLMPYQVPTGENLNPQHSYTMATGSILKEIDPREGKLVYSRRYRFGETNATRTRRQSAQFLPPFYSFWRAHR